MTSVDSGLHDAASSYSGSGSIASSQRSGLSSVDSRHKSKMSMVSQMSDTSGKLQTKLEFDLRGSPFRLGVLQVVTSAAFNNFMLAIIVLNTIVLAAQTSDSVEIQYGWIMSIVDITFLGLYVMEAATKIYCMRTQYFRVGWNCFDFVIVVISTLIFLFQIFVDLVIHVDTQVFRLLRLIRAVRALRSLRVLRTINFLKSLQMIVATLLRSVPAMMNIVFLAVIVIFIFTVVGKTLYASVDPHRFGTLATTAFRLFQLTTFENWGFYFSDNYQQAPTIWLFLWSFIILVNFIFVNLFVAVIVSNMQQSRRMKRERKSTKPATKRKFTFAIAAAEPSALGPKTGVDAENAAEDRSFYAVAQKVLQRQNPMDFYNSQALTNQQRFLYQRYFKALSALECGVHDYEQRQKILLDLVEMFKQHSAEKDA